MMNTSQFAYRCVYCDKEFLEDDEMDLHLIQCAHEHRHVEKEREEKWKMERRKVIQAGMREEEEIKWEAEEAEGGLSVGPSRSMPGVPPLYPTSVHVKSPSVSGKVGLPSSHDACCRSPHATTRECDDIHPFPSHVTHDHYNPTSRTDTIYGNTREEEPFLSHTPSLRSSPYSNRVLADKKISPFPRQECKSRKEYNIGEKGRNILDRGRPPTVMGCTAQRSMFVEENEAAAAAVEEEEEQRGGMGTGGIGEAHATTGHPYYHHYPNEVIVDPSSHSEDHPGYRPTHDRYGAIPCAKEGESDVSGRNLPLASSSAHHHHDQEGQGRGDGHDRCYNLPPPLPPQHVHVDEDDHLHRDWKRDSPSSTLGLMDSRRIRNGKAMIGSNEMHRDAMCGFEEDNLALGSRAAGAAVVTSSSLFSFSSSTTSPYRMRRMTIDNLSRTFEQLSAMQEENKREMQMLAVRGRRKSQPNLFCPHSSSGGIMSGNLNSNNNSNHHHNHSSTANSNSSSSVLRNSSTVPPPAVFPPSSMRGVPSLPSSSSCTSIAGPAGAIVHGGLEGGSPSVSSFSHPKLSGAGASSRFSSSLPSSLLLLDTHDEKEYRSSSRPAFTPPPSSPSDSSLLFGCRRSCSASRSRSSSSIMRNNNASAAMVDHHHHHLDSINCFTQLEENKDDEEEGGNLDEKLHYKEHHLEQEEGVEDGAGMEARMPHPPSSNLHSVHQDVYPREEKDRGGDGEDLPMKERDDELENIRSTAEKEHDDAEALVNQSHWDQQGKSRTPTTSTRTTRSDRNKTVFPAEGIPPAAPPSPSSALFSGEGEVIRQTSAKNVKTTKEHAGGGGGGRREKPAASRAIPSAAVVLPDTDKGLQQGKVPESTFLHPHHNHYNPMGRNTSEDRCKDGFRSRGVSRDDSRSPSLIMTGDDHELLPPHPPSITPTPTTAAAAKPLLTHKLSSSTLLNPQDKKAEEEEQQRKKSNSSNRADATLITPLARSSVTRFAHTGSTLLRPSPMNQSTTTTTSTAGSRQTGASPLPLPPNYGKTASPSASSEPSAEDSRAVPPPSIEPNASQIRGTSVATPTAVKKKGKVTPVTNNENMLQKTNPHPSGRRSSRAETEKEKSTAVTSPKAGGRGAGEEDREEKKHKEPDEPLDLAELFHLETRPPLRFGCRSTTTPSTVEEEAEEEGNLEGDKGKEGMVLLPPSSASFSLSSHSSTADVPPHTRNETSKKGEKSKSKILSMPGGYLSSTRSLNDNASLQRAGFPPPAVGVSSSLSIPSSTSASGSRAKKAELQKNLKTSSTLVPRGPGASSSSTSTRPAPATTRPTKSTVTSTTTTSNRNNSKAGTARGGGGGPPSAPPPPASSGVLGGGTGGKKTVPSGVKGKVSQPSYGWGSVGSGSEGQDQKESNMNSLWEIKKGKENTGKEPLPPQKEMMLEKEREEEMTVVGKRAPLGESRLQNEEKMNDDTTAGGGGVGSTCSHIAFRISEERVDGGLLNHCTGIHTDDATSFPPPTRSRSRSGEGGHNNSVIDTKRNKTASTATDTTTAPTRDPNDSHRTNGTRVGASSGTGRSNSSGGLASQRCAKANTLAFPSPTSATTTTANTTTSTSHTTSNAHLASEERNDKDNGRHIPSGVGSGDTNTARPAARPSVSFSSDIERKKNTTEGGGPTTEMRSDKEEMDQRGGNGRRMPRVCGELPFSFPPPVPSSSPSFHENSPKKAEEGLAGVPQTSTFATRQRDSVKSASTTTATSLVAAGTAMGVSARSVRSGGGYSSTAMSRVKDLPPPAAGTTTSNNIPTKVVEEKQEKEGKKNISGRTPCSPSTNRVGLPTSRGAAVKENKTGVKTGYANATPCSTSSGLAAREGGGGGAGGGGGNDARKAEDEAENHKTKRENPPTSLSPSTHRAGYRDLTSFPSSNSSSNNTTGTNTPVAGAAGRSATNNNTSPPSENVRQTSTGRGGGVGVSRSAPSSISHGPVKKPPLPPPSSRMAGEEGGGGKKKIAGAPPTSSRYSAQTNAKGVMPTSHRSTARPSSSLVPEKEEGNFTQSEHPAPRMMFCTSCGKQYPDDAANFCGYCGHRRS